jgi:putative ABC transport system permease protein
MKTLLKISWRNVWRNPKRSLIMIFAIITGLWAGIFVSSLMYGLVQARFEASIEQQFSHIQIHHPEFIKDNNLKNGIPDWEPVTQMLAADPMVRAFSGRTLTNGMLATATLTRGVNIIGIDPLAEAETTKLNVNLMKGSYFENGGRHPILIGKSLAEKTKLQERSRLVLTFQNAMGELVSAAFRVAGIYQTANTLVDEMNVYVLRSDLTDDSGDGLIINEIALLANDPDQINEISKKYKTTYPDLSIRTWAEISPELCFLQEFGKTMLMMILTIILLALAFGLANTMLMSVYERVHELGMLMAVGMNRRRVFGMIMFETAFLTFLGALGGMLLGFITNTITGLTGLDLAVVGGDILNDFGYPSMVYPNMEPSMYLMLTMLVVVMVFITSIFPAVKALRLKPAEAVRKE